MRHIPPRLLGSLVGGMIILTNTRTLLRSEWLDVPGPAQYAGYAVLYAVWAAAVVHSFREYRKDRLGEAAEAAHAVAERNASEDVRQDDAAAVQAGRPSAPRD